PRPSSHRCAPVQAAGSERAPRLVRNSNRPPAARPAAPIAAGGAPAGARGLAVPVGPPTTDAARVASRPGGAPPPRPGAGGAGGRRERGRRGRVEGRGGGRADARARAETREVA